MPEQGDGAILTALSGRVGYLSDICRTIYHAKCLLSYIR